MTLSHRLRLLVFALSLVALTTACFGSTPAAPTVPPATALAEAAAGTATALALAETSSTPALPTAPPLPTDTALPPTATDTAAEPSATPSPVGVEASATPAGPATPDPNEAVGDIVYQDPLDGTGTWFWTFADDVAVFGIDSQRQQLKGTMLQAGQGWRFTVSPDTLRVGNQQVQVTAHTAACSDNDEYGLMFRGSVDAEFNYSMYLFTLRCSGTARFLLIRGAETTVLADWTPAPGAQAGAPADNTLMVWAAGSEFRFYVNDQFLFTATDPNLTDGFYGLYLNDRTAGGETVYFEDLIARAVNK